MGVEVLSPFQPPPADLCMAAASICSTRRPGMEWEGGVAGFRSWNLNFGLQISRPILQSSMPGSRKSMVDVECCVDAPYTKVGL